MNYNHFFCFGDNLKILKQVESESVPLVLASVYFTRLVFIMSNILLYNVFSFKLQNKITSQGIPQNSGQGGDENATI